MPQESLRKQIAVEAARLLTVGREANLGRARIAAARNTTANWVREDNLPSEMEIRDELFRYTELLRPTEPPGQGDELDQRLGVYRSLLEPLTHVMQPREAHPEGDALYHSLQVFTLMRAASPWDEEVLLAALLHDVGKGIDPLDHVAAGLAALEGSITERTEWLIACHHEAQRLYLGTLGPRAVRRLSEHPDYDALLLLARCDRDGRVPGAAVPETEQALDAIRELAAMCGDEG